MAIGAIATYAPADGGTLAVITSAVLYAVVNAPSVAVWAAFGTTPRRWLTDRRHLRIFNIAMAVLLVMSLYPLRAVHSQAWSAHPSWPLSMLRIGVATT